MNDIRLDPALRVIDTSAEALAALVDALERRTKGPTGRQFEHMVSPAMAGAFVQGWLALDRNIDDIPGEWRELADALAAMEDEA